MGPRKDNFTKEMDLKLIEFVKQHPELYSSQVELSTYHIKTETKEYLWKEFAPTVGETPLACEKRWKAIKFRYLRTTANPGLTYEYVDKLRFIDKDIIRKFTTIERIAVFNSLYENGCDNSKQRKRKISSENPDKIATTSKMSTRTVKSKGRTSAPFRYNIVDEDSSVSEENILNNTQVLIGNNSINNFKSEESDEEIVVCIKLEESDDIKLNIEEAKIDGFTTCNATASDIYHVNGTEKYNNMEEKPKQEIVLEEEFSPLFEVKLEPEAPFLNNPNSHVIKPEEYVISYKLSNESVISHSKTNSSDSKIKLHN